MLGLQVGINFEQQLSVVAVANPLRQREHINTGLQTFRNEVMPQIMMRDTLASSQLAGPVKAPLTF